jgi:hypothetical protein
MTDIAVPNDPEMRARYIERLANPPVIISEKTIILSPPLGSVAEYMAYLKKNRRHYRRFFRGD